MSSKVISKKGSLTIPRRIRQAVGMVPGCAVDIVPSAGGYLVIRTHAPACILCGSQDGVKEIDGRGVCRKCAEKFVELYSGKDRCESDE